MTTPLTTETLPSIEELERQVMEKQIREEAFIQRELSALDKKSSPPVSEENDGFFDNLFEVVGSAAEEAGEQFVRTAGLLSDKVNSALANVPTTLYFTEGADDVLQDRGIQIGDQRIAFVTPTEADQITKSLALQNRELDINVTADSLQNFDIPDLDRPDSTAGKVSKEIVQFLGVFMTLRKFGVGGASTTKTGRFVGASVAGAVTDAAFFDPTQNRLSNIVEGTPLANPLTEFLASDGNDTAGARLKQAAEGFLLGSSIEAFMLAARSLRSGRALKKAQETPLPDLPKKPKPIETPPPKPAETPVDDLVEVPKELFDDSADPNAMFQGLLDEIKGDLQPVAQAIKKGDLSSATDLTGFNADRVDWEQIYRVTGDQEDGLRRLMNTVTAGFEKTFSKAVGPDIQTADMTAQIAKSIGVNPSEVGRLFADVKGSGGITARFFAARRTTLASAERLRQLAQIAAREGASSVDEASFLQHLEYHAALQAQLKGSQTEIARALQGMRNMSSFLKKDPGSLTEELFQAAKGGNRLKGVAKRIAEETSEESLNRIVRKASTRGYYDVALEVYINGLLSAPSTQVVNGLSNTVKLIEGMTERYISASFGPLRQAGEALVGREVTPRVTFREANASLFGTFRGISAALHLPINAILKGANKEGFAKALTDADYGTAYKAFLTDTPILDQTTRIELDTLKAIRASGDDLGSRAYNALGHIIRLPGRLLMTGDELFKTVAYHQELGALSYRQASREAAEKVQSGAMKAGEVPSFITERVRGLLDSVPEEMGHSAMDAARYATFQEEITNGFVKGVQNLRNAHPVMKFVVPFLRTPWNIMKQSIGERTPLALLRKDFWEQVARGGPEGDAALARLMIGTTFLSQAIMWSMDGNISGSRRQKSAVRNTERFDKIPPYSIKIGDRYYQYNRLEPFGLLMGMGADIGTAVNNWSPDQGESDILEAMTVAATVATANVTDKTWFKGIADIVMAIQDPNRYLKTYADNLGTTVITPYSSLLRRINIDHDPIAREAWTFMDKWKAKIPGMSDELPPRRDYLGRPREKTQHLGAAWISPIAAGVEEEDPLYQELARLSFNYSMPDKDLYSIGIDVTPEQYSRFLEIRGQEDLGGGSLEDNRRKLISSAEYQSLKDSGDFAGGRELVVKGMVSKATRAAKLMLLEEDEELKNQVEARKLLKETFRR